MRPHFVFLFINVYYFCADQPSSSTSKTSKNSSLISINTVLKFLNSSKDSDVKEIKNKLRMSANGKSRLGLEQATKVLIDNESSDNEDLKEAFKAYDINKDGFIDESDLISAFKNLKININESEAQRIISNICHETDDNKISFNEFEKLLRYNVIN